MESSRIGFGFGMGMGIGMDEAAIIPPAYTMAFLACMYAGNVYCTWAWAWVLGGGLLSLARASDGRYIGLSPNGCPTTDGWRWTVAV